MKFKKFIFIFIYIFSFNIFSQDNYNRQVSPVFKNAPDVTTAPSYLNILRARQEKEKKEQEAKAMSADADIAKAPSYSDLVRTVRILRGALHEKNEKEIEELKKGVKVDFPRLKTSEQVEEKAAASIVNAPPISRSIEEKVEEKLIVGPKSAYSHMYMSCIFEDPELNSILLSIRSNKAKVQDILDVISRAAGIDFIIDPDVRGTVGKLSFSNVTPGFLLNYILTHNNPQLALVEDMNIWRIMLRAKAEEYIKVIEREQLVTKVFDINHASINDRLKDLLEKAWANIVTDKKALSFLFIDTERKRVFLRGFPKFIQEFKKFLDEVDKASTQVRVDAMIVFAEKDYNFSFGINYSGIYNRLNSIQAKRKAFDFVGAGGTLLDYPKPTVPLCCDAGRFGNLFVNPENFAINLFTDNFITPRQPRPVDLNQASGISIPFVFGGPDLNLKRLNLLLNAAENEQKAKVVSRPSVMTSDNEVAKILIGEAIPIQATAVDILSVAVQNITSINYKDVGISLEVKPIVSPDKKTIRLELFIEESRVVAGFTQTNPRGIMENPPVIDTIKVHNKVDLKNGQTVVIGGLSRCDERRGNNKVPLLYRLPWIGKYLFTSTNENKEEFEQFIFITPTITD